MLRASRLIYLLAIIKFVLPFILQNSYYQPHRDEFLYLAEGRHLSLGYMEVPPLLSLFAWLTHFLGDGIFWIKFWPDLFSVFTFLLVAKMVQMLGGKQFAIFLSWLPFVICGYLRLFFLFQANFLEVFFWTSIAFTLFCFIQTKENKWLYWMGLSIGLGMMSKYSVAFYTASILLGILLTKHRNLFLNKHFYFSLILAFAIFLPNLVWQYNHRFPVVMHMEELQKEQLQYIHPVDFVISQFILNLPCVFIWLAGLAYCFFSKNAQPFRVFAWTYVFVILLLVLLHGKDYYALGSYPVLFAFGAYRLEELTTMRLRWVRYVSLFFAFALGLFGWPLVMPMAKPADLAAYYRRVGLARSGSFRWEDLQYHPLPQDFADMIGWKEITEKAAHVYNGLPVDERSNTIILSGGYFTAGAMNYYGPSLGLPEVYSTSASFLFWMPENYSIRNVIWVGHEMPENVDPIIHQFKKISVADSLSLPYFREDGMKFFLLESGSDSVNLLLEQTIRNRKKVFRR